MQTHLAAARTAALAGAERVKARGGETGQVRESQILAKPVDNGSA